MGERCGLRVFRDTGAYVHGRAVSRRPMWVSKHLSINIALDPAELGQRVCQMKMMLRINEPVQVTRCPVELRGFDAGE